MKEKAKTETNLTHIMQSLVDTSYIRLITHAINNTMAIAQFLLMKFRFFTNHKRVLIYLF